MRVQTVILALAVAAAALPLGCAYRERDDRNVPPPAYRIARDLYVRPADEPGSTTASDDGQRYDTGDYVTADHNGPDAVTYDGSTGDTYHPYQRYDNTLSPYLQRDLAYAGTPYNDPFYGPYYSGSPYYYGYPYGFYGGVYGSRYSREYRRDHDYVRRDDVHYPRDARNDGDRSRNEDRRPREPSPSENQSRSDNADVHRGDRDVIRAEQNRRDASEAARTRDARPDRSPRNVQGREQTQEAPRRAPTRIDPPRKDRPARDDHAPRNDHAARDDRPERNDRPARNDPPRPDPPHENPRADRPARGGTDAPPARNDAPRQDRPSRGGTDDLPRKR